MNETDTSGPAVVLLSGGLDSMVTAAIARERGMAVLVMLCHPSFLRDQSVLLSTAAATL